MARMRRRVDGIRRVSGLLLVAAVGCRGGGRVAVEDGVWPVARLARVPPPGGWTRKNLPPPRLVAAAFSPDERLVAASDVYGAGCWSVRPDAPGRRCMTTAWRDRGRRGPPSTAAVARWRGRHPVGRWPSGWPTGRCRSGGSPTTARRRRSATTSTPPRTKRPRYASPFDGEDAVVVAAGGVAEAVSLPQRRNMAAPPVYSPLTVRRVDLSRRDVDAGMAGRDGCRAVLGPVARRRPAVRLAELAWIGAGSIMGEALRLDHGIAAWA